MNAFHGIRRRQGAARASIVHGAFELNLDDFLKIAAIIADETGIGLARADAPLVYSRLGARMRECGLSDFHDYVMLLTGPDLREERERMARALTANASLLFQDRARFGHFRSVVLPPLIARAKRGRPLRFWCAGSPRPQEAYSAALTILSAWPEAVDHDVKILGTDEGARSIAAWRGCVFTEDQLARVPDALRMRYFARAGDERSPRRAGEAIMRMVAFEPRGLMDNGLQPESFDAIFLGTPLFPLEEADQAPLWSAIVSRLAPHGWLYVGSCERIQGPAALSLGRAEAGVHYCRRHGRATHRGLPRAAAIEPREVARSA